MNSSHDATSPEHKSRADRIRQISDDCLAKWARGELISEHDLNAANPDLQPELELILRQIRRIAQAGGSGERLTEVASDEPETTPFTPADSSSGCLNIRCPHCRNPVELLVDCPFTDITCSTCGSAFSLLSDEAKTCLTPPLQTLGHFELVGRLGIGAFGTVWKAHDLELDRTVAIKIPRRGQLDPVAEEQFLREARVAAQLRHPHIVNVHEIGREGETIYIVSDLIRGVSLTQWLTAKQPTPRESATLLATIADALHYAHQQGVVHRDLKPSNVMIDREGQPHLLDFGLAKRNVGEITMTVDGQILGTPAYMSPEQAEGDSHHVDRRTDIYSMGVMLFEILTRELPFRGSAQMQIHQKVSEDAPDVKALNRFVPRDLATVCMKCLERDANRRYPTAGDFASDLDNFLLNRPITARPISATERIIRWSKRNPWKALASSLTLFLAIAGPIAAFRIEQLLSDLETRYEERENTLADWKKDIDQKDEEIKGLDARIELLSGNADPWKLLTPEHIENSHRRLLERITASKTKLQRLQNSGTASLEKVYYLLAYANADEALNRDRDAFALAEAARDVLEQLSERNPQSLEYKSALSACHRQLARLIIDNDKTSALKNLEQSEEISKQLAKSDQDSLSYTDLFLTELKLSVMFGAEKGIENLLLAQNLEEGFADQIPKDPRTLYLLSCYLAHREPVLLTRAKKPHAEQSAKASSD